MSADPFARTNAGIAEARADSHPGYRLVSFGEIGIPLFELRLTAEVLDHKPINPFAEFVLRAVSADVADLPTMERLLGLDRRVMESTVVALIGDDLLSGTDQEEVEITPFGEDTLENAKQIQIRSAELRVTFDPLTGEVLEPFGDYLAPKQLREEGMREVGLPVALVPELHQLEVGQVERAIKGVGSGREQARDVLALRSMRRFRVYRQAVGLLFQAKEARDLVLDVAFDGSVSERHSLALAEHGLRDKLAGGQAGRDRIGDRLRGLRRATVQPSSAKIETLPPWQLSDRLTQAIAQSSERLIVTSPGLQGKVLDEGLMEKLRRCADSGVSVHIGWGYEDGALKRSDSEAVKALDNLARESPNLNVRRLNRKVDNVLICDSRWMSASDFPWLSFEGDAGRALMDERALTISDAGYVDAKAEEWISRLTARSQAPIDYS